MTAVDPPVSFWSDPYPQYRELAKGRPVRWDDMGETWVVTGYDAARSALANPDLSSAWLSRGAVGRHTGAALEHVRRWFMWRDGPEHHALRRQVTSLFSDSTVRRRSVDIRTAVGRHHQRFSGNAADGVTQFAHPLVTEVITDFAGLPHGFSSVMGTWADTCAQLMAQPYRQTVRAAADAALAAMREPFAAATHPPATTGLLAFAGISTTVEAVARLMALAADGHLPPTASPDDIVAEVLRYDTAVPQVPRVVAADTSLAGERLAAGENVLIVLAAANRDSRLFPQPDTVRFGRAGARHLSFGYGRHRCVGAPLAEAVLRTVITEFRATGWPRRIGPTRWHGQRGYRAMAALPLDW